jgi:hypothetical protein
MEPLEPQMSCLGRFGGADFFRMSAERPELIDGSTDVAVSFLAMDARLPDSIIPKDQDFTTWYASVIDMGAS